MKEEDEILETSALAETLAEHNALPLRYVLSYDPARCILTLECGHEFPVPELENKEEGIEIRIGKLMNNFRVRCWDCYETGMLDAEAMIAEALS